MAGGAYSDSQMAQLTEQMKQLRETMVKSAGPKSFGGQLKESAAKSPAEFMMQALTRALAPVLKVLDAINKLIAMVIMPVTNLLLPFMIPIFMILLPIVRFMNTLLRPIMQNLMQAMKKMTAGGDSGDVMAAAFGDAFGALFSQILPVLMKGFSQILIYVIQIGTAILEGLVKALPALLASILPGLATLLDLLGQVVMTLLTTLWNGLSGVVTTILGTLFNWAKGALGGIIDTVFNFFTADLPKTIEDMKTKVGDIWTAITELPGKITNVIMGAFTIYKGVIEMFFGMALISLQTLITAVVNPVIDLVESLLGAVYSFLNPVMKSVDTFLTLIYDNLQRLIAMIFGAIDTLLAQVGIQAYDARKAMYNAYAESNRTLTTSSDLLTGIKDTTKSTLESLRQSPDTSLLDKTGQSLMAQGTTDINEGGKQIASAAPEFQGAAEVMNTAADKLNKFADTLITAQYGPGGSPLKQMSTTLSNMSSATGIGLFNAAATTMSGLQGRQ